MASPAADVAGWRRMEIIISIRPKWLRLCPYIRVCAYSTLACPKGVQDADVCVRLDPDVRVAPLDMRGGPQRDENADEGTSLAAWHTRREERTKLS